ncbi:hypothetical protein ABZ092_38210 [Streptomyces bobili]
MLLLGDGREMDTAADLSKDETGTWSGTLTFPAEGRTPELLNIAEGRIKIGGSEAAFVRPDTSDWTDAPGGHFVIRVQGSGAPPF